MIHSIFDRWQQLISCLALILSFGILKSEFTFTALLKKTISGCIKINAVGYGRSSLFVRYNNKVYETGNCLDFPKMNEGELSVKKTKYSDEFVKYGFTSIVVAGIEKTQCIIGRLMTFYQQNR